MLVDIQVAHHILLIVLLYKQLAVVAGKEDYRERQELKQAEMAVHIAVPEYQVVQVVQVVVLPD